MSVVADEPAILFHLHLSDATPVDEEEITLDDGNKAKVLWKDVLVEGEYPMSPSATGATSHPMRVIAEGESDAATKTIAMSDLTFAHKKGAFKYVTVPTSHRDGVLDNTGYVPRPDGLRIVEKKGKKVMQAALGFTEPDVKGKVQRGTIPDVSAGIFFNWVNKHTKEEFKAAMKHVALTPVPFMGNLDPFPAVFASDDEIAEGTKVEIYNFADGESEGESTTDKAKTAEIVWNEKQALSYVTRQINAALNPQRSDEEDGRPLIPRPSYYVQDVSSDNTALVEEFFKGTQTRYVIPFTKTDEGDVSLAPATRWVEVREAMIAASEPDFEELSTSKLRDQISIALSDQLGTTDSVYRVEDVSLDHRARITNKAMGKSWIARFASLDENAVWLQPAAEWESILASDKPNDDAKRPATSTPEEVVKLDDSPEARLRVARQRRRQTFGLSSQSQ